MTAKPGTEPKTIVRPAPAHWEPESKMTLTPSGQVSLFILWCIVLFVFGTIGGVWLKVFWMGWVFAQ